jgi:integrase
MANKIHIRVRKETNNLYLDFAYLGCRCREQTALKDTPANRKKVETLAKRIEARMLLSEFDYENFFPNSKNLKKIYQQSESVNGIKSNTTDATTSSFKIYAEQWFSLKKVEWRNSHSINMLSVLEGSLIPFFGQKDLRAITKQDILTFRSMLCQKPGRTSIFLTPKTINNHMQLLHSILADAADEYSFTSPFRKIKTLKSKKGHIAPFSLEEVDQIIRCVREDYKNYYKVRFFTGMRTGEIDGLQWKNVDFKNKQILIREALVRGSLEYTKTDGSQREIP